MKSKPPQGRGRDRQDRKGAGRDHTGKDHGGKDQSGKNHGGRHQGQGHKGGHAARSGFGPKKTDHKEFGRNESGRKEFGRKDFSHKPDVKKPDFKRHAESRPRPDHAQTQADPKPQSRIDHGGGAVDVWLFGHHAVSAALANQERRILRLLATPEALDRLRGESSVPQDALNRARSVSRKEIDNLVGENAVHQGVAMLTRPIEHHLEDVLEIAKERETCCVVLLDQVSDPHNVGAILRSAAAFDAVAVITLDRRAAAETGTMAKSASGALDRISFVQTTNLARAIEVLKQNQFWVLGLEADGEKKLAEVDLKGRIAFVMGTEGEGLRRLVRESCDQIVRLPINAASESLNVSNAAAVALYERSRQIG